MGPILNIFKDHTAVTIEATAKKPRLTVVERSTGFCILGHHPINGFFAGTSG